MPKVRRIYWTLSFVRAFRKRVVGTPDEARFRSKIEAFVADVFDASIRAHKLSGRLEGLWAFTVSYDCRVVFKLLHDGDVLLIDIGSHEDVY
jgi:mRNA-degrading endonuclease YafQ of YafQ-DinJ toxin-antitoxin module